jgi:transcriptional regulator with XRE-family HTH domain
MGLNERISEIIKENSLKQKELASMLGVTESYISALLKRTNINPSKSFANLIEEKLGYSANWVLTGEEPKFKKSTYSGISDIHKRAISQLEKMPVEKIKAVLAFIKLFEAEDVKISSKVENPPLTQFKPPETAPTPSPEASPEP